MKRMFYQITNRFQTKGILFTEFELNHMYILGKFTDELNFICRDWNRLLTSYIDVIWAKKWSNKTAEYYKYISLKFWRSSLLVLNDFLQIKSDSKKSV